MALMSDERRKEMEEEMNRFELEISGPEETPILIPHSIPSLPRPTVGPIIPEVLARAPPPPPPPVLTLHRPPLNRPRFIPSQLHRNFMEPHFPPPTPPFPVGSSLPMPPGFCPPPSAPPSTPTVASAPTIYAAPFVKTEDPTPQKIEKSFAAAPTVSTSEEQVNIPAMPTSRKKEKKKKMIRMAGGQAWEDNSLMEWETDDFRIFCGDLGNDVTDEVLIRAFSKYPSFIKAKVIRDKRTNKTKGFGFVSFKDPQDFIKAMREMNGRYVGSRPIKLRKSTWRDRNIDVVKKKQKEKEKLGLL